MAPGLGWDDAVRIQEIELYIRRVAAERASQEQLDDVAADASRRTAPEPAPLSS